MNRINRRMFLRNTSLAAASLCLPAIFVRQASAAEKPYKFLWSHYTGWEPWQYIADSGILKKWCGKFGVNIQIVLINDYATSVNQYTAGDAIGVAVTNMDSLTMPAVGGVDSEAIVVGDYSNGNDGLVLMNGTSMKDVKGRNVLIVQNTVSSYLLSRGLQLNGMLDRDVREVNTSDSVIGATFANSGPQGAVVTWNPILMQLRNLPKATMVFDSSKIPGEILDLMIVRKDAPEAVKKALVGAWYECMAIMSSKGKQTDEAIESMAKSAGGTVAEFKAQLRTTYMYYAPEDGAKFAESAQLKQSMKYVNDFCFDHGLYGQGVKSSSFIGIEFPDGSVLGDSKNVKLRFPSKWMRLAAENKL